METKRYSVLLGFIFVGIQILSVSALKCFHCLNTFCESGKMEARNCTKPNDACIKYVGEYSLGTVLLRNCGSKKKNNTCEVLNIHNEDVRVCYLTCTTDGCNAAPPSQSPVFSMAYLPLLWFLVHDAMS